MNDRLLKGLYVLDSTLLGLGVVACMYWIFKTYTLSFSFFLSLVVGVFSLELLIYLWHRFLFHKFSIFKKIHDLHHQDPKKILFQPCIVAFFVSWVIWYFASLSVSREFASIMITGLLFDYFCYGIIHDLLHHNRFHKLRILRTLHLHHALHHAYDTVNFGVNCRLFDYLFGTLKKPIDIHPK